MACLLRMCEKGVKLNFVLSSCSMEYALIQTSWVLILAVWLRTMASTGGALIKRHPVRCSSLKSYSKLRVLDGMQMDRSMLQEKIYW